MLSKMKLSSFVIVTALVAMLAWGEQPAFSDEEGTGVWLYNTPMSISLINLTNYPLTYLDVGPDPVSSYGGSGGSEYILSYGGGWTVAPFRTGVWNYDSGGAAPRSWDGARTLTVPAIDECTFDIVFKQQKAYGLAEHGFWVGLSPHGTEQGWSTAAGSFVYGRWVTPLDDVMMHNVMTLIGPTCMVTLYSGDNTNLVVVVQQYYAESDGVIMDDTEAYQGAKLDFVDNGGYTVPR